MGRAGKRGEPCDCERCDALRTWEGTGRLRLLRLDRSDRTVVVGGRWIRGCSNCCTFASVNVSDAVASTR